ncbi:MAG: DUF3349 domain-containing protein [Dermatophilaceae bacterium]
MIRLTELRSALDWLLDGYPDGIPHKDFSPILALLRRQQLTDEEVGYLAARLVDHAVQTSKGVQAVTPEDVEREIAGFTHEQPEEADIQRVEARLGSLALPLKP